jgi:hypothetical protein
MCQFQGRRAAEAGLLAAALSYRRNLFILLRSDMQKLDESTVAVARSDIMWITEVIRKSVQNRAE